MTFTPKLPAARTAPSTSAFGAWSPPIASSAMVSMSGRGYSATNSTTSRPLYWPHFGHTRWGSLGSWQLGHSERPDAFRASCARRVLVRLWECLRLGFGISLPQQISYSYCPCARAAHDSEFQIAERAPAIVHFGFTIARGLVPVLATTGADSSTGLAAHPLHRQRQQDLLPEDILQFQAVFVKSNFRFARVDLDLFLFGNIRGGPVIQIEFSFQRKASARQTTVALRHHFHGVTPPDAHLPA